LLKLPAGFRYRTLGWAGDTLRDGTPCPAAHDGMGVVGARDGRVLLVRNHEIVADAGAYGPASLQYDSAAGGGTVTLEVDAKTGELHAAWPSLAGTLQNCAGGTTPWGTWLSCEEYVHEGPAIKLGSADTASRFLPRLKREHGFVFEVDPAGAKPPALLEGMGQFRHEAAVVHEPSGIVYLTEDREPRAGFYRYVPKQRGALAAGGRLQMLRARGAADLRRGLKVGQRWRAAWVDIEEPGRGHSPGAADGSGVLMQGLEAGGTSFTRLEGCFATRDAIYFTATNGGDAAAGQVWVYHPADETLALVHETRGPDSIRYPDNIAFSPRGGLVVCEDGDRPGQMLWGIDARGAAFPFAQNHVVLENGPHGFTGDYRGSEWAGTCFSPDGTWMYANIYHPGFTVAITGPWRRGLV
jgi:uncharacterized protein